MSLFKRDKQRQDHPTSMSPLAAELLSDNDPDFLKALEAADYASWQGDFRGIYEIREAIRIKSGKESVSFKVIDDSSPCPDVYILKPAKKRALLGDPGVTCGYVANLLYRMYRSSIDPGQAGVSYGFNTIPCIGTKAGFRETSSGRSSKPADSARVMISGCCAARSVPA